MLKTVKRLNINLSEREHRELKELSDQTGKSMTELIRLGIGLVRITVNAVQDGHKLILTTRDEKALKELVIP